MAFPHALQNARGVSVFNLKLALKIGCFQILCDILLCSAQVSKLYLLLMLDLWKQRQLFSNLYMYILCCLIKC